MTSNRRITVAIVVSNLEYGGAQRQIVELANNIDISLCELHVVSLSQYVPLSVGLRIPRGQFHVVEKHHKYDISVAWRLAQLLRKINAHIVHGYLFDAEIAARLAGRIAKVVAVGGSERNTDYQLKKIQLATYRLTRSMVDFVIANSNAGAAFNSRTLGHPIEMYRVVHNGIDTTRFRPTGPAPTRDELDIPKDHFVIGMFGSFKAQKNHIMLFRSYQKFLASHPDSTLLLVGDQLAGGLHGSSDYYAEMRHAVRELGIDNNSLFVGNRDCVESLYNACDVTVLPSLFEGTPNVALESMACEVPVVATRVSDNDYVIRDGQTGYLVELDDVDALVDRLSHLADDPTTRLRMGKAARQRMIEEFSSIRLAEKTLQVYTEIIDARGT